MSFTNLLALTPDTVVRISTEEGCREALVDLGLAPEAFLAGSSPPGALRLHAFEHLPSHWVAVAHASEMAKPFWSLQAWPRSRFERAEFLSYILRRNTWWPESSAPPLPPTGKLS